MLGTTLASVLCKTAINPHARRGALPKLAAALEEDNNPQETCVQLLQLLISGVAQGCIYGLIALGFVLIYKATETVSFAQGDLMMVGAFGGLATMTCWVFRSGCRCRPPSSAWAVRRAAGAGGDPPHPGPAGVLHRDADHRRGLCAARAHHHDPRHRHRHPHAARALRGRGAAPGRAGGVGRAGGGDRRHRGAVRGCCSPCSATASWASPCRPRRKTSWRPITWAFRSSGSTAWCGAWRRRWRPSPACCWRPSPLCTPTWASSASRPFRRRWWVASAACPAPSWAG
jgi:hypothetical protein